MSANVWFTSDTHFGHALLARKRGFGANIREHDEHLVQNWNALVRPGDRVYHLGDFALGDTENAKRIAKQLQGQIYLIRGNHDKLACNQLKSRFIWIKDVEYIKVEGQSIMMCHYPMMTWRGAYKGTWMLYGHCHGSNRHRDYESYRLDVGPDVYVLSTGDYALGKTLLSFEDVKRKMSAKKVELIYHHEEPAPA